MLCLITQSPPPGSSVPGNSPGKNTEVGFHVLLQGISPIQVSHTSGRLFTVWASREAQYVLFHGQFQEVSRDHIYWHWVFLGKWSYSTLIKNNGILLSLKKEQHWVSCSDVDEPRTCHREWSQKEKNKYCVSMHIYGI